VTDRTERLARNESHFREINEQIEQLTPLETADFEIVCECADLHCMKLITINGDAYEAVRRYPQRFIVFPEHVAQQLESVISKQPDYWIVQKHGEAAEVAQQRDPRS
jgi:hypothetical protein